MARKEVCASSGITSKVMLEELKNTVLQSYDECWCFKLMALEKRDYLGLPHIKCMRQLLLQSVRKRLRFSGSGVSTDGKFLFLFKSDCQKQNNLLPRKRKLIFHEFKPSFFHHFLSRWLTASSLHPQPAAPHAFQKRLCLLLAVVSQSWLPCSCSGHYIPLPLFSFLLFPLAVGIPSPVCSIMRCSSKNHCLPV